VTFVAQGPRRIDGRRAWPSRLINPASVSPREILDAQFSDALGGLVAGSAARGDNTPSSDLDLIVLLTGRPAPMRCTEHVRGQLVEFFVHTEDSFVSFIDG
jgi:hypothetical protein